MAIFNRPFKIYLREKFTAARLYNAERNIFIRTITDTEFVGFCYVLALLFGILALAAIVTASLKLILFFIVLLLPPVGVVIYSDYDKWRRRLLEEKETNPK